MLIIYISSELNSCKNIKRFSEILRNSKKFSEFLRDVKRFLKILWEFLWNYNKIKSKKLV